MQKWPWKLNQIVNIKSKKDHTDAKEQKAIKQKPIKKPLKHQVDALYAIISKLYGPDLFKARVNKLQISSLMKSDNLSERVLGLERLIYNDEKLKTLHSSEDLPKTVNDLQDMIVDVLARKQVEEDIERKVQTTIQKKQQKYIQDVRRRVLKEENGPETAQTKAHLEKLEKLEARKLARSAAEIVRPQQMDEIVGQKKAVKALVAKMASPYPQHMIFYGPPGVGKTTAARLALEHVKRITSTAFSEEAPFIEVDGSTLRWDPRGITNPLLGSVHDPIYQGTRRDFAESGIPEPKLGLVSDAHGGVLFIDEIGEVDMILQNKLLKVLEDKRVFFESSYYDPTSPKIPEYIKRLFSEGAPADFVLIAATTRRPEAINPALRSRSTEIFFDALTPLHIQQIVEDAAVRLGVALEEGVPEFISEYTIEGRKAVNMLIDAFSLAAYQAREGVPLRVKREHLLNAIQTSRSFRYVRIKAEDKMRIGKVMGLGVQGFLGSALEIECAVFPAFQKGKGHVRFNETAGSMAKDSVFNAASVLRKLTDKELSDYDVHVNVVGGGNIDGPSAGVAISMAIYSALIEKPLRQDVAVTGEISLQGYVKPVGGVLEKIYGAQQAGMKKVLIPRANADEMPLDTEGLDIVLIDTIEEALNEIIVEG